MSYVAGSELRPGTTVAGCRIEALIGRGGMGAVYRAEEEGLGRKVALKVIAPELAQDERFRERFLRESKIAASLDHPHVVPIYQAGEEEGLLFLAMRYVEGTDLAKLVAQEGALQPRRTVELLSQVAEALDAAHEKGLVHRDVKPSNVLIAGAAGREHCYLADFGLTKRTGSLSGMTAAGDIVGTLEYVAPEQITGDPLDERADVYSLGCVLYECLTGQSPFPRATDVALLWAHVHEEPVPPSKARPELPKELDTVLARGLAKEPGRRYRSAGELVASARAALGIEAAPPRRRARSWVLAQAAVARSRWSAARVGAVVAVVLIAIAAPAVLLRGGDGSITAPPNSVALIDPATNLVVDSVSVGIRPGPVTAGEGSVWVGNLDDRTLSRIDPTTRTVLGNLSLEATPTGLAVGAGAVWIANGLLGSVARVDPSVNAVTATIEDAAPRASGGSVAVGENAVWFASAAGVVARIDPSTNMVVPPTGVAGSLPSAVATGFDTVWVANAGDNNVVRINPRTNGVVRMISVGGSPRGIAVGEGAIWVTSEADDLVFRIDAASSSVKTTIPVGDGPTGIAFGEGAVWVANSADGTVSRIDPERNEVIETIPVGNRPVGIAVGSGSVWVSVQRPAT